MQQVKALSNPTMESGNIGQTETSRKKENRMYLRLVCQRFELGQSD
jgi:hypothetical protein